MALGRALATSASICYRVYGERRKVRAKERSISKFYTM
jgi:hypothetical protein